MPTVPVLTDTQIGAYERDGFVALRAAFDAAEMRRITAWAAEAAALAEEPGGHWVFHERSRLDPRRDLISRIEYLAPFHAGFAELCEALKPSAAQVLGEPAVLFKEKINFKLSGGGEEIGLFLADGTEVDSVIFGAQSTDISQGRMPDGGESWIFFSTPTPGATNAPVIFADGFESGDWSAWSTAVGG